MESFNNHKFFLVEVIAFILSYLKQCFEVHLEQISGGSHLKAVHFDWVITVPAIWRARGKRMMREAAYMVRNFYIDTIVIFAMCIKVIMCVLSFNT